MTLSSSFAAATIPRNGGSLLLMQAPGISSQTSSVQIVGEICKTYTRMMESTLQWQLRAPAHSYTYMPIHMYRFCSIASSCLSNFLAYLIVFLFHILLWAPISLTYCSLPPVVASGNCPCGIDWNGTCLRQMVVCIISGCHISDTVLP